MTFDPRRHALLVGGLYPVRWGEDVSAVNESLEPVTHGHPIIGCQLSADFGELVSVDAHLGIRVWDIDRGVLSGAHSEPWNENSSEISTMALDPSGRRLITSNFNNDVRLWNCHSGTSLTTLDLAPLSSMVTISQFWVVTGRIYLACAGWDRVICLFQELEKGEFILKRQFKGHTDDISALLLHETGIVSGSVNGEIFSWAIDTGHRQASYVIPGHIAIECMTTDRNLLFVGDSVGTLHRFDLPRLECIESVSGHGLVARHCLSSIAFDADNRRLYTGDTLGYLRPWTADEDGTIHGEELQKCHPDEITDIVVVKGGAFLATVGADMCIRLWKADTFAFVGLFTDSSRWNLLDPSTYVGKTPFPADPEHFGRGPKPAAQVSVASFLRKISQDLNPGLQHTFAFDDEDGQGTPRSERPFEETQRALEEFFSEAGSKFVNDTDFRLLLHGKDPLKDPIKRPPEIPTTNRPQDLIDHVSELLKSDQPKDKGPPKRRILYIPTPAAARHTSAFSHALRARASMY
jgi:hypothetical protein